LDDILQSFPQLQLDDILQNLLVLNPLTFLALDNASDMFTHSQMLCATEKQDFLNTEEQELQDLLEMNVWKYWQILCLVLSMQMHCHGHLIKHKECLCADGHQQQFSMDYFQSYAPVITWTTVCLVLLLSVLLNLHCWQVNFTRAFPQADINVPVFLFMFASWNYQDADGNSDSALNS